MSDEFNPYVFGHDEIDPIQPELEPASRGARLAAVAVESAIGFAIAVIWLLWTGFDHLMSMARESIALQPTLIVLGIAWCAINVYLFHQNGQTIGKKLLGIRVVRTDGSKVSLARWIVLRAGVISLISAIPLVGWIVAIVDPLLIFRDDRRCLHDLIADTRVVLA